MKTAKLFFVFMLMMVMPFLTGCWNYHEVDNMAMVSGFAIDKGGQGNKYHLTFEFLDLTTNTPRSKVMETDGDTVFQAIRNAIGKSEKKLYFSHAKVMVISEEIASEGLSPVLDLILRDAEARLTLNLIVSKEKTAGEILQQKPVTDQLIGMEIFKSLNQNSANLSESPNVELYHAYNMMAGDGISLILPTVKIAKTQSGNTTELDGTAVFKKDKLQGYLSRDETKFLLLLKNQIKGGLLLTSSEGGNPNLTIEISTGQTKVTPVISNNNLTMNIEVKVKAVLGEDQTSEDNSSQEGLKKVQKQTEQRLENGISSLINKVQNQYDSDIFGFGSKVNQNAPDWWGKTKSNWDEAFRTLKYTISTEVTIENTAMTKAKIKVGD